MQFLPFPAQDLGCLVEPASEAHSLFVFRRRSYCRFLRGPPNLDLRHYHNAIAQRTQQAARAGHGGV
jgi:hypothetical protein